MNARRLRWRRPGQHQRLLVLMQRQLASWLGGWSLDQELLQLHCRDSADMLIGDATWLQASGRTGSVWIGAPAGMLASLGGRLANAAEVDCLGLGGRIGDRAVRELLASLLERPIDETCFLSCVQQPVAESEVRFGGFQFTLRGRNFAAEIVIDATLGDHWLPATPPMLSPLVARATALGKEPLNLDVVLDLGSITLGESRAIRVGDVLVSTTSLSSEFLLRLPDAGSVATGRLFRIGNRRAIRFEAESIRRMSP